MKKPIQDHMTPITTLPRRTTVEPLRPGDFDHDFTNHVNFKRRSDDWSEAIWTLRLPIAVFFAFQLGLIAFAVWLML